MIHRYQLACDLATLAPPPPEMRRLFEALRSNQAAADRYFGTLAGTVPIPEFFAPENMERIIGKAYWPVPKLKVIHPSGVYRSRQECRECGPHVLYDLPFEVLACQRGHEPLYSAARQLQQAQVSQGRHNLLIHIGPVGTPRGSLHFPSRQRDAKSAMRVALLVIDTTTRRKYLGHPLSVLGYPVERCK